VPRGPRRSTPHRTRIGKLRHQSGYTQKDIARLTGVSLSTIRRLEGGHFDQPPLRVLVNYAHVLRVPLSRLYEPSWLTWKAFDADAPKPPQLPPPAALAGLTWPPPEDAER